MYQPAFRITSELLSLLTQATEARAWIAQAVVDVSWLPRLQRDTATRLAHSSTAIEGNPLTLPEVEALARGEGISATKRDTQEVLNYLAAMRWIWQKKSGKAIQEKDLLQLQRILVRGTLSEEATGHYKSRPNRIVNAKGQTIYTPPPPEQARPLTKDLLIWTQTGEAQKLHPVITSAIAHHRLVSIHPFLDGNGRTARALSVWILYARGFDTHHLFALDEYFEEERQRYYEKIQQVRDMDDDLTDWLEYVAQGVVETLKRTKQRIASLQIAGIAPKMLLTKRQEDVLRYLRDRGRVKSPEFEKAFLLTRARVGQILKPLVAAKLILREGQSKATTYRLA